MCSACHEHTKKQQNQVIHTDNSSSVYQTNWWKCPYCGMYLDVFDTDIMDHKQKRCLQEHHSRKSSFEDELDEAYQRGYEDGQRDNVTEN